MFRLIIYILLFSALSGCSGLTEVLAQQSPASPSLKRVKACGISFLIPKDFKSEKASEYDSCIAVFSSKDEGLKIDYGLYNSPFSEFDGYRNIKKETVSIGGKRAELVTYTLDQSKGRFIAQIYVKLGRVKGIAFNYDQSLYMVFQSYNQERMETARRIFGSIRFK